MCKEKEKKLASPVVPSFQLFVAPAFQFQSAKQGWPTETSLLQVQVVKRRKNQGGRDLGPGFVS